MLNLTAAIDSGIPMLVFSPHLDDAVLSCGGLILYARKRTQVTVVTLFTEGAPPPYTLSARRYLKLVGACRAEELFRERRAEDREVLEAMGVTCIHGKLTDALFRRKPSGGHTSRWERLLPELGYVYPVYRIQITAGRMSPNDGPTLVAARDIVEKFAFPGPSLLLAPLGVGGHIDHVLTRTAAERSGARTIYYSDFPYNVRRLPHSQRHRPDVTFIQDNNLAEARWSGLLDAKAELIRAYRTQESMIFPDGHIPAVPERFFIPRDGVVSCDVPSSN